MPTSLVPLFPGLPGGPEMIVILLIVVLLFGANKLPKLARSSGQAMGEFKKGREEIEDELQEMRGDESFDSDDDDSFGNEDSFNDNEDSFSNEGGFEQANTQGQSQAPQSQQNQPQRSQNEPQRSQNQNQRSGQSNAGGWGTSTESGRERDRR